MKTKTDLQTEVKNLTKDVKALTKNVDTLFQKKLDHEPSIQKLRNESKQLELDLVHADKLQNKKAQASNTKKAPPLSLVEKKDFETHKAEVKRQAKDNDAREKLKKEPTFGQI
jgi:hypothetical protein